MQILQLAIPEPCHENWHNMTPTDQGRFCNACAKQVVDFSMMTDTEVLNYFTGIKDEKVCGRALPEQLNRKICRPKEPKKRLFWYWNYIVMFFMFFAKGNAAKAQGKVRSDTTLSPLKTNESKVDMAAIGGVKRVSSIAITGKITDQQHNPVAFASVMIKGQQTGVIADSKGEFKIIAAPNSILTVSSVLFKTMEVTVGNQKELNIIMENQSNTMLGGFTIVSYNNEGDFLIPMEEKLSVVIAVKDSETQKGLDHSTILIQKNNEKAADTAFSDSKGKYKIKGLRAGETYHIQIQAAGYESNEFTIDENDFKDKKQAWDVLLKKQQPATATATATAGKETRIRLGQVSATAVKAAVLYVVDGVIMPAGTDVNPDDVADMIVLQAPAAMAIYGIPAAYGAIVITTRKVKEIKMKELVVASTYGTGCSRRAGGISFTNTYEDSLLIDTVATVKNLLTNAIKVYPNPVQRNTDFSVAFKFKQAGNYSLQVTDAGGRVFLQQNFYAREKKHTVKLMSDSRWTGGVYFIRVFDAQNKLVNKSSFIVQ